jgi:hypothetical protein
MLERQVPLVMLAQTVLAERVVLLVQREMLEL